MSLLALSLPDSESLRQHFPLLESIQNLWARHPDSLADVGGILDSIFEVNPLSLLAAAAAVGFLLLLIRERWKIFILVFILVAFGSLLALPSGRSVIRESNKVELKKRPVCIVEAVMNGATIFKERLNDLKACQAPTKRVIVVKARNIDQGADDGKLMGEIDGPDWQSRVLVSSPTPPARWRANTKPGPLGGRVVYLERDKGLLAIAVEACPSDEGEVSQGAVQDKSGRAYISFIYNYVDRDAINSFLPGRGATKLTRQPQSRLALLNRSGRTLGYIVPAFGFRGHCAVVSGPYKAVAGGKYRPFRLVTPAQTRLVSQTASRIKVGQITPVSE